MTQLDPPAQGQHDAQTKLSPGDWLFKEVAFVAPGGPAIWVLDEKTAGDDPWDPLLARSLSADLGAFVVCVEVSRSLGRFGLAVFIAGRTVEFTSHDSVSGRFAAGGAPSSRSTNHAPKRQSMFTGLYAQLTGSSGSDLDREHHARRSLIACGGRRGEAWRAGDDDEPPLALAVFALAEKRAFDAAWNAFSDGCTGWHWHAASTMASEIPYIVLTRDGEADTHLWEVLARHLDVPAAAVVLRAPAAVFSWWNIQPGDPPQHGHGRGAAELIHRLMPATFALGERPGILRICSERASLSRPP